MNSSPKTEWAEFRIRRRDFLSLAGVVACTSASSGLLTAADVNEEQSFKGCIGITTGGGLGEQHRRGELPVLELPRYVRRKLGVDVIDINTRWLSSYAVEDLTKLRAAATAEECRFSNLKVNHRFGDLYSRNAEERSLALAAGKRLIDAAGILGTRWIRFTLRAPYAANPVAHRELADYAEPKGIQLLVENGSRTNDIDAVTKAVKSIGRNVAPCPDTGNWADDVRMDGLRRTFAGAASCDFKVYELTADRRHPKYDLKQCFDIGWRAGFRGPWIIEHMKPTTDRFVEDTIHIRELLEGWIEASRG